jgi:threonylcarbamoyladenosine tRNA methylthiotransferase MtaB
VNGPEVITLGCRLNAAESEVIRRLAAGEDNLVIVNSCAVTNEAVRQTRQAIRRAKRARPEARLVVTGCAAQVEPETFAAMPEVDRVVGNAFKFEAESFFPFAPSPSTPPVGVAQDELRPEAEVEGVTRAKPREKGLGFARQGVSTSLDTNGFLAAQVPGKVRVSDIMGVRETAPHLAAGFAERARAFVEVQNGCDHRCTFCIIPYGRGNSRSVPAGLIVERVKALVGEGFGEVVLTGVDVTSYGPDLPGAPSLGLLVERILRHVPELPRLRLSSLDCIEIDPRLEEMIAHEPRFMPHLHLSFQAGDDMVLKRMKRRHSRAQAVEMVARLKAKRPELAIGADLIAGFPTETEAMHENSLRLIDECDIVMGHIFPFSPKRGTPAARMPLVPPATVKARARRLREACAQRKAAWLEGMVGTVQRVLIEKGGKGHAENFAAVVVEKQDRSPRALRRRLSASLRMNFGQRPKSRGQFERSRESLAFARQGVSTSLDTNGIVSVRIAAATPDTLIGIPA